MSKIRRTFKYRLYPTRKQRALLEWTLAECQDLYNAALQERRDAWRICRKSVSFYDQSAQLVELKRLQPAMLGVYSQVLQDVLHRVDKTFKAFFRRGNGFPRFRSRARYDSFTYPQLGFNFNGGKLALSKIGHVKIKFHRELKGIIKTLAVKREGDEWYACFSVECEPELLPVSEHSVGIDMGLESFATFSDGEIVGNPRWFRKSERKLRVAQRTVSRRKKFSNRWKKAVRMVAKTYRTGLKQRSDFQHKLSRKLVNYYGFIALEDLNVQGLANGILAKSVRDAGWSAFIAKLTYKAESAGRVLVKVDPRGTSQRCSCGLPSPKKLSDRVHHCACGLSTTRDHASALEILRLGLSRKAPTMPVGVVAFEAPAFSMGRSHAKNRIGARLVSSSNIKRSCIG